MLIVSYLWRTMTRQHPFMMLTSTEGMTIPHLPRRVAFALTAALLLLLIWLYSGTSFISRHERLPQQLQDHHSGRPTSAGNGPQDLPCRTLPGAENVVVVLKTGSTEFEDKFPVHVNTTLRCYPHSLIFSDYEEKFQGLHVIDALQSIGNNIKGQHPDFELWRRLQQGGRSVLRQDELSGTSSEQDSKSGKTDNPGWRLDKFKFLPMANRALYEYPHQDWYLFLEVDTYIFWQTFLAYMHQLNPLESIYIGSMIYIGEMYFAHGGTGFVLSRKELENLVRRYQDEQAHWDQFVANTWAGDAVVGVVLQQLGTRFIRAESIFQGHEVGSVPYDDDWWCRPSVSYHHLAPDVVQAMWEFEQRWISGTNGASIIKSAL